jgi:hypothetical protein
MFEFEAHHAAILDLLGKQVFFIGSCAKSGSSWLQLMLDQHPEVSCRGEGHFADILLPRLTEAARGYNEINRLRNEFVFEELAPYPALSPEIVVHLWASAVALQLSRQSAGRAVRAVGDKTPDNVFAFRQLAGIFPKARFIHIVRDGRDCAISGWFHNQRVGSRHAPARVDATFEAYFEMVGTAWTRTVAEATKFGAERNGSLLTVRYEDLRADPAGTLIEICRFLGVSEDPAIAAACRDETTFERLSGGRPIGEEDRDSFFRKAGSGDWRELVPPDSIRKFEAEAGTWLAHFGYEPSGLR